MTKHRKDDLESDSDEKPLVMRGIFVSKGMTEEILAHTKGNLNFC